MPSSKEQIELSSFIKDVHKKLRTMSKECGFKIAWEEHCKDVETLRKYAESMKSLSCKYWTANEEDPRVISRIKWVHSNCVNYFKDGGLLYQRAREYDIAFKNNLPKEPNEGLESCDVYKLLDVGSCFNPFKHFEIFDVLAIDLYPGGNDVKQCDFLNLDVSKGFCDMSDNKVNTIQGNSFHVVVFSLLLEYIPSAEHRLNCCEKAYRLLAPEGILIVITPDAKHVGANAKIIKSWRFILAKIGFLRIRYEKLPYIHCMIFRKSLNPEVTLRWATLHESKTFYKDMFIPQDVPKINK